MSMSPLVFYESFVLPNYQDFCQEEYNVRKGFNAVVSVSHLADNYYYYYRANQLSKVSRFNKLKDFKAYLASMNPYFNDIQSIAIVYKHLYAGSIEPHVTIASGGAVECIRIRDNAIEIIDGFGDADSEMDAVIYRRKDGTRVRLKRALTQVIDLWQRILDAGV